MLIFIKNLIFKFNDKRTKPKNLFVDKFGKHFIVSEYISYLDIPKFLRETHKKPSYEYRSIIQNKWGKWVPGHSYLRCNSPLKLVD